MSYSSAIGLFNTIVNMVMLIIVNTISDKLFGQQPVVGGKQNMSKENTRSDKKKIKRCKEGRRFDAACFIILTLVLFVVAYPLYWVIISSISAPSAVSSGKVLLHPIGFTPEGLRRSI